VVFADLTNPGVRPPCDAAEALRIGLANRVVAGADLNAAAELAARLAAQSPVAVRGARAATDAAWYRSPEEDLRVALEEQIRCLKSEDFKEARHAMAEGRSPRWRGARRRRAVTRRLPYEPKLADPAAL
jgi:enoyl-CoA hydratase/carnithine racemase